MLLVTKSQHLRQSRTWGARAVPSGRKTSTGSRAAATQYLHAMPAAQFHNTAEMINDRLVGACSMCCSLWGYFAKETAQTGLSAGTSQPAGGQKQPISVKGAHAEAWLPRAVKFGLCAGRACVRGCARPAARPALQRVSGRGWSALGRHLHCIRATAGKRE